MIKTPARLAKRLVKTAKAWRTPHMSRHANGVSWDKAEALEALPPRKRALIVRDLSQFDRMIYAVTNNPPARAGIDVYFGGTLVLRSYMKAYNSRAGGYSTGPHWAITTTF